MSLQCQLENAQIQQHALFEENQQLLKAAAAAAEENQRLQVP